ncbi:hypothetical protein TNCV_4794241 [Trichonephila clavipes]|nr:hypothetical protein TNCV_4794241 [Trichonephila clavipes]
MKCAASADPKIVAPNISSLPCLQCLLILVGHNGIFFTSMVIPTRSDLPTHFAHSAQDHPLATMKQSAGLGRRTSTKGM